MPQQHDPRPRECWRLAPLQTSPCGQYRANRSLTLAISLLVQDAVVYQVHERAFQDSNGDGIGDFPGLMSQLDHIADLGANALLSVAPA
jgi:hypothetical protein